MSKTKGTGVDPLELTQQFGTDALRYMLASMAAPGTDIILSEDRILGARAFANKIWNAARFLFVNLEKVEAQGLTLEELAAPEIRAKAPYPVPGEGALAHRWIFSRLSAVAAQVNDALENFRFHEACQMIYHFFWGDFCDWYIEWVKPQLTVDRPRSRVPAWRNIFAALDAALRLLHPVMPFLTEELWHQLPQPAGARSIALDKFPEPRAGMGRCRRGRRHGHAAGNRRRRAQYSRGNEARSESAKSPPISRPAIRRCASWSRKISIRSCGSRRFPSSAVSSGHLDPTGAAVRSTAQFDLRIAYGDTVDKPAEIARLKKEIERLAKDIESKQSPPGRRNILSSRSAPSKVGRRSAKPRSPSAKLEHQEASRDRLKQLESAQSAAQRRSRQQRGCRPCSRRAASSILPVPAHGHEAIHQSCPAPPTGASTRC